MDYGSSKSRGFGFVNFKDPEVAKTVLSQVHRIQGRLCEVRLPRCKVSDNNSDGKQCISRAPISWTIQECLLKESWQGDTQF